MLWSAETIQHRVISHVTAGQSFIPAPHLNCPVTLEWTGVVHDTQSQSHEGAQQQQISNNHI